MGLFGFLTKRTGKKRQGKSEQKLQEERPAPPPDVLPQDHLQEPLQQSQGGNYQKSKVIGQGAYGRVEQFDKPGAKSLVKKVALNEDTQTEIDNESKVLDTLGDHQNIVKKSNEDLGGGGLGLEMLKGGNVAQQMDSLEEDYRKGKISHTQYYGTLQYLTKGMLGGLDHMHDKDLVHGDVKPENAMLDEETLQPKLIDFGSTRKEGEQAGSSSPGYMAPEVGIGERSGGTSKAKKEQDIYAIGSMNYRYGEGRKTEEGMQEKYSHINRGVGGFQAPVQRGQAKVRGEQAIPEPAPREDGKQDFGKGAYGEFVNALTNTKQTERPGSKDSLEAPYLQDSLMQDHEAQEFLKARIKGKTDAPPAPPPLPELSQNTGTRQDHKHKTDMQKELLKATKGTRKSLDKEAKTRSKDPEIKKAVKKMKKAKKDLKKGKVPEPTPEPTVSDEESSSGPPDFY